MIYSSGPDVKEGYLFKSKLGSGQFGEVWEVSKDGQVFAIKIIWYKYELVFAEENIEGIIENCKVITNPALVQHLYTFKDVPLHQFYIVMEFCPNNIFQFVKNSEETGVADNVKRKISLELLQGLSELHGKGIMHGNIKLTNSFIDKNGNAKLGDFGLRKVIDKRSGSNEAGDFLMVDFEFLAPEILGGEKDYDFPSDVWSLGVVLYYLFTAKLPFHGSLMSILDPMEKGEYPRIQPNSHCPEMVDVIHSMLTYDSDKRPKVKEILSVFGF